jgi:hypothetical protein
MADPTFPMPAGAAPAPTGGAPATPIEIKPTGTSGKKNLSNPATLA